MGLWDVVMYGVLFMVIIAPQSIFGSIQLNSYGMTPLVYIIVALWQSTRSPP